jgi:hypothetical protein
MATQRTLARDLIEPLGPMTNDSGVGTCTPEGRAEVLRDLNLSCQALIKRIDSEGTLFDWYIPVDQGCIALPQTIREIRYVVLNGVPLRQRDEWYIGKVGNNQFNGGCSAAECLDVGDFVIPSPLPKRRGIRIGLVAMNDADAGKICTVQVTNEYGAPVQQDLTLLGQQAPAIMDAVAYDVTYFKKPKTVGDVSLQLCYDDGQRFYHCHYLPETEEGMFRRKAIPQRFWGCNIAKVKGKMRYIPITSEDQIVPFNDIIALGNAQKAIAAWRRGDTAEYQLKLGEALNELNKQMQDADSARNVRQVVLLTQGGTPSQANNCKRWA